MDDARTIRSDVFGALRWNEPFWEGRLQLPGQQDAQLSVEDADGKGEAILEDAAPYLRVLLERPEVIKEYAATDLLAIYNENWALAGRLRADEFMRRIFVESVVIYPASDGCSGSANCYLDDGELFGGHYIEVSFNKDGSKRRVTLAG